MRLDSHPQGGMMRTFVVAFSVAVLSSVYLPVAQQPAAQQPQQPMSFFITSAGSGKGADLGGLAGADRTCQTLATAAGSTGKMWHAYLSASAASGQSAVNARDPRALGVVPRPGADAIARVDRRL